MTSSCVGPSTNSWPARFLKEILSSPSFSKRPDFFQSSAGCKAGSRTSSAPARAHVDSRALPLAKPRSDLLALLERRKKLQNRRAESKRQQSELERECRDEITGIFVPSQEHRALSVRISSDAKAIAEVERAIMGSQKAGAVEDVEGMSSFEILKAMPRISMKIRAVRRRLGLKSADSQAYHGSADPDLAGGENDYTSLERDSYAPYREEADPTDVFNLPVRDDSNSLVDDEGSIGVSAKKPDEDVKPREYLKPWRRSVSSKTKFATGMAYVGHLRLRINALARRYIGARDALKMRELERRSATKDTRIEEEFRAREEASLLANEYGDLESLMNLGFSREEAMDLVDEENRERKRMEQAKEVAKASGNGWTASAVASYDRKVFGDAVVDAVNAVDGERDETDSSWQLPQYQLADDKARGFGPNRKYSRLRGEEFVGVYADDLDSVHGFTADVIDTMNDLANEVQQGEERASEVEDEVDHDGNGAVDDNGTAAHTPRQRAWASAGVAVRVSGVRPSYSRSLEEEE